MPDDRPVEWPGLQVINDAQRLDGHRQLLAAGNPALGGLLLGIEETALYQAQREVMKGASTWASSSLLSPSSSSVQSASSPEGFPIGDTTSVSGNELKPNYVKRVVESTTSSLRRAMPWMRQPESDTPEAPAGETKSGVVRGQVIGEE